MKTRIVHFSDPHAGGPAEDFMAYLDKRWVGVFNYRFRRRFRHDQSLLVKAVAKIIELKPDVAVCTGDLTSTGQPGEFAHVKEILTPLRDSGIPVIYLPGNHDCYVRRAKCVAAMLEMTRWLNHGMEFRDLPVKKRIAGVEFLLLNTSEPSNLLCSWGFVKKNDMKRLEELCHEPKSAPRILVSHYPMFEDHPLLRTRHRLFGQKPILAMMREKRIDLSLCGHVHRPYLVIDDSGRGECCAGSVTRNGNMVQITYDDADDRFTFEQLPLN